MFHRARERAVEFLRCETKNVQGIDFLLSLALESLFCYDSGMQSFSTDSSQASKKRGEIITVGRVEDVPPGRCATVELLNGDELALYNVGGEFYASENFCPHKGAALADGFLCQYMIECNWHGWKFDVRTGQCLNARAQVRTYRVFIEEGLIKIEI